MELVVAVGVGVLLLVTVWYWERRTRRSTRQPFAGRLGGPAGCLRPSDRFDVELAPAKGWEFDDGLGRLTAVAEERLRTRGLDKGLVAQIKSVDDYVRLVGTRQALDA
jgi:hypothetical protein